MKKYGGMNSDVKNVCHPPEMEVYGESGGYGTLPGSQFSFQRVTSKLENIDT
jgi:hypothetical protein